MQRDFHVDEALNVDPTSLFERMSTKTYEVVSSGAAGQLGFGFMMGFSSGYFLRKVYVEEDIIVSQLFFILTHTYICMCLLLLILGVQSSSTRCGGYILCSAGSVI